MARKYKFILTLPDDFEVDSALEIEGHVAWPNYSQASPVGYRGVFDTYEDAEKYASDFEIYKYTGAGYDSYYDEEFPLYYVSIFDAEDAAAAAFGIEPGDMICPHPDEYQIEEIEVDEETAYKYKLYFNDKIVYDSYDEDDIFYDSYEEAEEAAEVDLEEYEIEEEGEYPYKLEIVEILGVRIEEINDFIIRDDVLVKYLGNDTEVVIPDGVYKIESNVFSEFQTLTDIEIPESVEYIGREAFYGCPSLTRVKLPSKLSAVDWYAFSNCTSLTSVVLPTGLTLICRGCFRGCTNLESINIPHGVTKIDDMAFSGCMNLANIEIPDGVIYVGSYAFDNCTRLIELEIPRGVTQIGCNAFAKCINLKSITIPDSVTHISGDYVFAGCEQLVIKTCKGSYAEKYAREHGISVELI